MADAGADLLEVGQLADDEIAERDVLLHDLVLALRERAGLAEDVVGDTDLADVVEATGAVDHRASPLVETELGGEERGVAGDILGMTARVVVLRIDRDDQPLEDVESDRLLERHRIGLRDADAVAAAGPGLVERPRRARRSVVTDSPLIGKAQIPALTEIGRRSEVSNCRLRSTRRVRTRSIVGSRSIVASEATMTRNSSGP